MTSSYDDDFTLLDSEIAHKVVHMLLSKVGGRYSKELGVNVDAGEEEVEKWFLAVALFHRHLTFDVLKKTFQKLIGAGIVSVRGMLHMEEEDIADILETAGYTTYKHRAASRVRRLALQLEAEHKGKVSTLKHIQDSHEVCRHISNLHGLSTHTCNIFLRELRGVWPGAATDYDRRTNRAAMHLRIAEFDKSEESNKSSILNPHTSLKHLAERTGVDERDLEVALVKLGLAHERHYRECPGGPHCTFLISSDEQANPEGQDLTG
jgi:endonuclease III